MSIVHVPFYPSDWLAGTVGLSDAEKGVYITLVARMYEMAGPIERDDNRLFRVCGSKSKASFVKALNYLISEGKILVTEGGLFNEKVAKVIQETTEKSAKAKAAAQSRWDRKPNKNNEGTNANASAKHMPDECQPKPKPYPKVELGKPNSCSFDEFWADWPNKNAKEAARKAWGKLKAPDRNAATNAVRDGWYEKWQAANPRLSPIHPASYLNGKRWNDEFQPQFSAISGGSNVQPTSKSAAKQNAFIGGASQAS